jgi:arylsulfatase A-like enzyme
MEKKINRKDFLKLASLLPTALALPPSLLQSTDPGYPNIIVLVFDAWSAVNNSLYDYPRQTTPNLDRLAEKAVVYYNHHAGGYFTTPGTASLLTGVLPWRHQLYSQNFKLQSKFKSDNLFGLFPEYFRLAYSHNALAQEIFLEMANDLDILKPREDLYYTFDPVAKLFRFDYDASSVSWIRTMETIEDGYANSIFLSRLWSTISRMREARLKEKYPLGLPKFGGTNSFLLEDSIDWLVENSGALDVPSLTYYHLLPPHKPYNTRREFHNRFLDDNFYPPQKPEHFMTYGISYQEHLEARRLYDEYVLFVDAEIKRLFDLLSSKGTLDKFWIILTSDHGELFERGIHAHGKPSMHRPLVNIPLLIFPPGQEHRIDVHQPTSSIDILPTLLSITGKKIPSWLEGIPLPPFNPAYQGDREIYVVDGQYSDIGQPYSNASIMLRQAEYKLIYHFGKKEDYAALPDQESVELFDLDADPEEMNNLADKQPELVKRMMQKILVKLKSEGVG